MCIRSVSNTFIQLHAPHACLLKDLVIGLSSSNFISGGAYLFSQDEVSNSTTGFAQMLSKAGGSDHSADLSAATFEEEGAA